MSRWRALIPLISMAVLLTAGGCSSGEVAGDTDGVLGMREGGQGVTFSSGGLEGVCQKLLDCSPPEAQMVTVADCVDLLEPLFDDLLAEAPPACRAAFEDMAACMGVNAECVDGELVPGAACDAENARGEAACSGWEPSIEIDIENYIGGSGDTTTSIEG